MILTICWEGGVNRGRGLVYIFVPGRRGGGGLIRRVSLIEGGG